ncbi:MAG: PKD domain-containing protein [Bacteroidota bacterium]
MKKLNILLIVLLFFHPKFVEGQTKVKDTITRKASIGYDKKGNLVSFKPETPPLIQVAGAPKASYSFFWEMGDGSFSKDPTPKKVYKKKGEYKVNLSVTNNYDNGKPPKTRPKLVAINDIEDQNFQDIASLGDTINLKLFNNREPVPDEEMVVVMSYQNLLEYTANGKLYLFYNDKEFKNKNFELLETRTHFGEIEIVENGIACVEDKNNSNATIASADGYPVTGNTFFKEDVDLEKTLAESKSLFSDVKVFEFDAMDAKETRNLFFTFKTTPEMIKDTSATVKMRGVYVPDRSYKNHKKKTLEMEIVTSHDPNKMSSNGTLMNYRLVRAKTLHFKTRFQNDGEGPARMIRLETDIPDMFDKKTLQIVDSYPKCPICPKGEEITYSCLDTIIKQKQIHFTFKNIYIPGSQQKNVTEKDSTKGYVKYTMKFAKDFHKQTTRSRTAIIFDKNEPVITNYAVTRFKPGLSVGAKAGYNIFPSLENSKSYFVSATLSPYKSYRWYWQVELQNSFHSYDAEKRITDEIVENNNGTIPQLHRRYYESNFENYNIEVPILMRYNLNNYIGIGAGIQANINITQKENTFEREEVYEGPNDNFLVASRERADSIKETFRGFKSGVLFDLTAGFARIGPSAGIRYVVNFEKDFNYLQLYAIWKF